MSTYVPSVEDSDAMTDIHSRMHGLISRAIPMNFRDEENLNDLLIPGQDEAYECGRKRGKSEADAREAATRAEVEALRADAELLDWLDTLNARKNERNGTIYGWWLSENHNRIALEDHDWRKLSVREAIEAARSGLAATATKKD